MPRCNKLKTKLKQQEFYCVACCKRVKAHADDICVKVFKNANDRKTPALRATCPKCGTNLTKFIKHDATERMQVKYGKC